MGPLLQQILVPLDGSRLAERALAHAVTMAHAADATAGSLTLFQVVLPPEIARLAIWGVSPALAMQAHEEEVGRANTYLSKVARRLRAEGLELTTEVLEGNPAQVIAGRPELEPRISLIVMATRGEGGRKVLPGLPWEAVGSTALKVVQGARLPVLLIRTQAGEQDRAEQVGEERSSS